MASCVYNIVDLTPDTITDYGMCGYKDAQKHIELRRKYDFYREYYPKGMRVKAVISPNNKFQGTMEYMPGELACRPVNAREYYFIQCIFVGMNKENKKQGCGTEMIKQCISEAQKANAKGVATVTRKAAFMAKKDIFLKLGFVVVDKVKPDFELLALKFDPESATPKFNDLDKALSKYNKGLYLLRSVQCPYTEKNINAIVKTAKDKFNIKAKLVDLQTPLEVQNSPCGFGTACIIYNGEIISHHPISNTRFKNIFSSLINK